MRAAHDKGDASPEVEVAQAYGLGAWDQDHADCGWRDCFLWKRGRKSIFEARVDTAVERRDGRIFNIGFTFHSMAFSESDSQGAHDSRERTNRHGAPI